MSAAEPSFEDQLLSLMRAGTPLVCVQTAEEEYALEVVRRAAAAVDATVWVWSAIHGVRDGVIEGGTALPDTTDAAAGLYAFTRAPVGPGSGLRVCVALDLGPHLEDARAARSLRETVQWLSRHHAGTLVLIDHGEAPERALGEAVRVEVPLPDAAELEQITRGVLKSAHAKSKLTIDLKKSGWEALVRNLEGLSRSQARRVVREAVDDRTLSAEDLAGVFRSKRRMLQGAGVLEFVEAPASLDQLGGLKRLKAWLAARELSDDERAREFGLTPPRGVLMLGVQGAGKSLCAKAIATAWKRPLLRLDAGALYDRYIGESEKRLREALRQAERMAPVVLWIDEIEKAFAGAASTSTDGGLSRRMFGTLLTWMQEHRAAVFLAATANDVTALPPELLRKGRFDEIFFIDLPGAQAREAIFKIHLKKRRRDPAAFDLDALVAAAAGYSGAEIEQAIVSALHAVFALRSGGKASADLSTADIVRALEGSPPLSVTMRESIDRLRTWADGRCVQAE